MIDDIRLKEKVVADESIFVTLRAGILDII